MRIALVIDLTFLSSYYIFQIKMNDEKNGLRSLL
jgi:hypothetical protein